MKDFPYTEEQEAWLQDLEKTRAKQTESFLHDDKGWCCLGRACKTLNVKGTKVMRGESKLLGGYFYIYDAETDELSKEAIEKLKLRGSLGEINGKDRILNPSEFGNLASFNDSGASFKRIAEYVRKNPKHVFTNLDRKKGK